MLVSVTYKGAGNLRIILNNQLMHSVHEAYCICQTLNWRGCKEDVMDMLCGSTGWDIMPHSKKYTILLFRGKHVKVGMKMLHIVNAYHISNKFCERSLIEPIHSFETIYVRSSEDNINSIIIS